MSVTTFCCADCDPAEQPFFPTVADLEAHIASDHLNFFPYECEKCKYAKFPTEYTLISHYHNDHNLLEFTIKFRHSPENVAKRKELHEKLRVCIGHSRVSSELINAVTSTIERSIKNEDGASLFGAVSPKLDIDSTSLLGLDYYDGFLGVALSRHEEERCEHVVGTGRSRRRDGMVTRSSPKIQCSLCHEIVAKQRSSMVYHANTRHGKYELYECTICQRKWQTIARSDVIKHFKSHHNIPSNEVKPHMLIDNRKKFTAKLNAITDKCFPDRKKRRIGYRDVQQN